MATKKAYAGSVTVKIEIKFQINLFVTKCSNQRCESGTMAARTENLVIMRHHANSKLTELPRLPKFYFAKVHFLKF